MEIKIIINENGDITITPSKDINKITLIGLLEVAKSIIMKDKDMIVEEDEVVNE